MNTHQTDAERITALEARVQSLEAIVSALRSVFVPEEKHPVADDDELDSKFGNPQVRRDPTARYWKGASYKGRFLSQCPPDYLDAWAKYKDTCAHMAEKEGSPEKKKYADYDRKDAARARGWSRRIRNGWALPSATSPPDQNVNPFGPTNPPREFRLSYAEPQQSRGFGDDAPNPFAPAKGSDAFEEADDTSFDFGANVDDEVPL